LKGYLCGKWHQFLQSWESSWDLSMQWGNQRHYQSVSDGCSHTLSYRTKNKAAVRDVARQTGVTEFDLETLSPVEAPLPSAGPAFVIMWTCIFRSDSEIPPVLTDITVQLYTADRKGDMAEENCAG
jgi:hypothetical protein